MIMGAQHFQRGYRFTLGRAFTHSAMNQACTSFAGGTLKKSVIKGLPLDQNGNYAVNPVIQQIAALFVELQEKRHLADYDRSEQFKRSDVLTLIDDTRTLIAEFLRQPVTDDRRFFLACLLVWKELANR